jgi:hypothetical protein
MKSKVKIAVLVVLAALVAAGGASWKWRGKVVKAEAQYKIAGWSWGDHALPDQALEHRKWR